jgi:pimeloyl-ACP methyl ester carboxylesterase
MKRELLMRLAAAIPTLACSAHAQSPRVSFVAIEKTVTLEVLDWGGAGRAIVLLAGNTQTAHSFDDFAPKLASSYHVYGITRRGFGASSAPATGYLADQLADDVLAVIDSLRLEAPVLAGHSLAGQELSSIGSRHPEKVAGLIYLDAGYSYAYHDSTRGDFRIDAAELKRHLDQLQAAGAKGAFADMNQLFTQLLQTDLPVMERTLRAMQRDLPRFASGPPRPLMPPLGTGIAQAIQLGMQRFGPIRAPALALYAVSGSVPAEIAADSGATRRWLFEQSPAALTFSQGVPTARVVILPNADHFIFTSNEADILREMRMFIASLPR